MLRKLWLLGVVALPIALLFGPSLATDTSYAMRDSAHFYYPLFEWITREWAAGRVPLWNPLENCGVPVLADATSSVFYPGKLIFALPVDFALRYKLYVVGHVVLAAAAAYGLARRFGASPPASALAAMAYSCGGCVVFQYCNVVFLVGAAWLPLGLLAIDRLLRVSCWRAAIGLAVTLSLMILGGDPQMAFHVLLIAAVYGVALSWRCAWPDWVRRFGLLAASSGIATLLSAIQLLPSLEATQQSERTAFNRPRNVYEAAAVAIRPAKIPTPLGETRGQSIFRGLVYQPPEGSHHELIYEFSIGPWRLLELVWPNVGGRMFPLNRRWMSLIPGEGRIWSPSLYIGLLPFLLALLPFISRSNDARLRWLQGIAVLFTLGSFGYYGLGWVLQELHLLPPVNGQESVLPGAGGIYWLLVTLLPAYASFRYPAKLLTVAALAISVLAAHGFDAAFRQRHLLLLKCLMVLGVSSAMGALVLWLLGGLVIDSIQAGDSTLGPFDGRGSRLDVIFALLHVALVASASVWLLSRAWKNAHETPRLQIAAVLLTAVELSAANGWLIFTGPAKLLNAPSLAAAEIHRQNDDATSEAAPVRVYRGSLFSWRPRSFGREASHSRMLELAQWEHDTLFPKHHLASDISLVESYGSIKLLDYESLLYVAKQRGRRRSDKTIVPDGRVLRMLGTKYMVLPQTQTLAFGETPAGSLPEGTMTSRMDPDSPRSWIVHDLVVMPPLASPHSIEAVDQRTAEVLFPQGTIRDYWVNAVIETSSPPANLAAQKSTPRTSASIREQETCRISQYEPQYVEIQAQLQQPGLVILSDTFYPGWRAYVSTAGTIREVPVYRVNRVQRGVWLPAGRHVVEYYYEPRSFYVGAAITALSWPMLGVVILLWRMASWFKSSNSTPASAHPASRPESAIAASPS